jgi:hypothetical protein
MFFADAVKFLASSQFIRRHGWMPGAVINVHPNYGTIQKSMIGKPESTPWEPRLSDLTAADWELHVPRPGEQS